MNDKQDLLHIESDSPVKTWKSADGMQGHVSALGIRFSGPEEPDLDGDFFDSQTYYGKSAGNGVDATLHHKIPIVTGHKASDDILRQMSKQVFTNPVKTQLTDLGIVAEHVLELSNKFERFVYQLAEKGAFRWSSGSSAHLIETEPAGKATRIKAWPIIEWAYEPAAAEPRLPRISQTTYKGIEFPNLKAAVLQASGDDATDDATVTDGEPSIPNLKQKVNNMSDQATLDIGAIAKQVAAELKAEQDAAAKVVADQKAHDEQVARDAVKAFQQELEKQAAVNDPGFAGKGVNVHLDGDTRKYDNTDTGDLAVVASVISSAHGLTYRQNSPAIVKALARRMDSAEHREDEYVKKAEQAMKMAGIKANETDFSTNASYGDEWIGVAYSGALWESIRLATPVVNRLGGFEFPAGAESLVLPLESTDPIWYKVAQAGDPSTALTRVANTVTASGLGTANNTMTLAKLGAAVNWTGEMAEDAVLPFAAQLRRQIALSGGEYLESAIIDGDTATTASTNINDIAGTPAGTDYFLVWNGFRKSPLVTTTANSRDGGALASSDYLATVKLMGGSGINALDRSKVSFIIDPATHYKSLELADVKSRDVFGGATIESGQLSSIFGYEVFISGHMNKMSAVRLANSAGKVDQDTTGNNTTGSILAVRWDQWAFGYRRRMSMEVERVPRSDSWEITAMLRAGLLQRDTEASAISYNLTV